MHIHIIWILMWLYVQCAYDVAHSHASFVCIWTVHSVKCQWKRPTTITFHICLVVRFFTATNHHSVWGTETKIETRWCSLFLPIYRKCNNIEARTNGAQWKNLSLSGEIASQPAERCRVDGWWATSFDRVLRQKIKSLIIYYYIVWWLLLLLMILMNSRKDQRFYNDAPYWLRTASFAS